jgi:hypothetical protein
MIQNQVNHYSSTLLAMISMRFSFEPRSVRLRLPGCVVVGRTTHGHRSTVFAVHLPAVIDTLLGRGQEHLMRDVSCTLPHRIKPSGAPMRTTLAIDDDVLAAAKHLAERQSKTVGEVISALARQSLHRAPRSATVRNGVPLLPRRKDAAPVTLDLVNQLRDELP